MPAAKKHKVKVAEKKGAEGEEFAKLYGEAWEAKCECGWSESRSSKERAERAGVQHVASPE